MKRKGFTLIELLIVIAIIALLMGILMPALNKARQLAIRLLCQTNLAGIGKAMAIYATANEDEWPRSGISTYWSTTGNINNWQAVTRGSGPRPAFRDEATISSCFYLLIRYAKVTPKQFVCQSDGAREFKLSYMKRCRIKDIRLAWDFGDGASDAPYPGSFSSYSYHMPFDDRATDETFRILDTSNGASPVCADRNPFCNTRVIEPAVGQNAEAHQRKGQNVLYKNGSVNFEDTPYVGIGDNNIWVYGDNPLTGATGMGPAGNGDGAPVSSSDAYLVNELNN